MRRLSRAALAFTVLVLLVTFTPLVVWWSRWLGGNWDDPRGDVLIVLSADLIDPETLGVASYWRVVYASRVYREGKHARVVVTGKGAAPVMRDLLVFRGVPADIITVDDESDSTRESAVWTARLLAGVPGRKVLVTSDMHMARSRRAFAKAGLGVSAVPFPYGGKLGNSLHLRWGIFSELIQETGKAGYYLVRGWI